MSYQSINIEMETLAATILAGETMPYGRCGMHTADEWTRAAQYAVDTGDWSELEFMCDGETANEGVGGFEYPADHFWRDSIHAERSGYGEAA